MRSDHHTRVRTTHAGARHHDKPTPRVDDNAEVEDMEHMEPAGDKNVFTGLKTGTLCYSDLSDVKKRKLASAGAKGAEWP